MPRFIRHLAVCLSLAGIIAFSMINSTPAVSNASRLVQDFAIRHHEILPAPPPSRDFVNALVATEDQRFFSPTDLGVDPIAMVRLVLSAAGLGESGGGGASIDQQLAKMLYTPNQSGTFLVDVEQVILAFKLHFSYSHSDILRMYSEMAYFGEGYYGLAAAAHGYFGRDVGDLSFLQAGLLAGIVNAPTADNPRMHFSRSMQRCRHVFSRLVAVHDLSSRNAETILHSRLGLIKKG